MTIKEGYQYIKTTLENLRLIVESDSKTISVIKDETEIGYRLLELFDTNKKIIEISYKKLNYDIDYKCLVTFIINEDLNKELIDSIISKSDKLSQILF